MTVKAEVSQTANQFASPLKFPALAANNYGLLVGSKMGQQVEMLPKEQPARFQRPKWWLSQQVVGANNEIHSFLRALASWSRQEVYESWKVYTREDLDSAVSVMLDGFTLIVVISFIVFCCQYNATLRQSEGHYFQVIVFFCQALPL